MPVPPATLKKIKAIREFISSGGTGVSRDLGLYLLIYKLFQNPIKILSNPETIDAILAVAEELEAYRGKGSQSGLSEFYQRLCGLLYHFSQENGGKKLVQKILSSPPPEPDIRCPEILGHFFFQRVRGAPVRSQHTARLRATAWRALGILSRISKHPEYLAHALAVAADTKAAVTEREAAIMFLPDYWDEEDPDEATTKLLYELEKNPPSRSFLVTVMQTQIELGMNDGFGAQCTVEDWEDEEEE
jgi:hypothetical protein